MNFEIKGHYDPYADRHYYYFTITHLSGAQSWNSDWFCEGDKFNIDAMRKQLENACGFYEIPICTMGDDMLKWHETDDVLFVKKD